MIKYAIQDIDDDDIEAVVSALKGEFITQGPKLLDFESKVAKKVSAKFSIATNSATSALHLSCMALGLEKGDIVWTSPISFVASANCALYCGAEVDFVDIDPNTSLICVETLKRKLIKAEKTGQLPKILIPVHLAGTSCDMKEIKKLSNKYGFLIIEDASHAIGAKYLDEPVGNCKYSDITIFSFHPVKIITTIEGGMALTNNEEIAKKIEMLRGHGITRNPDNFQFESPGPWYYEQQELGFNYRFNEIQAAIGMSQLDKLDGFILKRRKLMENYRIALEDFPNINFLLEPEYAYSSYHLAILSLLNTKKENHLNLFKFMRENNIFVQLHYWPIHLQPYYQKKGFKNGDFPNSERYSLTSFSLPLYSSLDEDLQLTVIKKLIEGFYKIGIL